VEWRLLARPVLQSHPLRARQANQRSVTVDVPGGLTESSGAIALLQGDGALVGAAVPDPATGTLEIFLIGVRPFPAKVVWFVFG
jgi:hypothetical protein